MSPRAYGILADDANLVFVSAASAWEIVTKHRLGKLPEAESLAADFGGVIARGGFEPLSVTVTHGEYAGRMRVPHKDPFDRILIAQSIIENLALISNEARFDAFGIARIW